MPNREIHEIREKEMKKNERVENLFLLCLSKNSVIKSNMDKDAAKEIQKLRNEIGDLQMLLFATLAELKALKVLSTVLWERQGVEMTNGRTIAEVLELLKKDVVDDKLKELADSDMNLASKMRRKMEKYLKAKKT